MGTQVDVLVDADEPPLAEFLAVRMMFSDQETRFSRFRPDSLLSRFNRGEPITDVDFGRVCRLAIEAKRFTGGLFNPFILPPLRGTGYDQSFRPGTRGAIRSHAIPEAENGLKFGDAFVRRVAGEIDLGGIVKGWTVDRAVGLLTERYPNACVNAGGDIRAAGSEPGCPGWLTTIDDSANELPAWTGGLRGALATSSTAKRRWLTKSGIPAHHLIDPRIGRPAVSPFAQVSVWADEHGELSVGRRPC